MTPFFGLQIADTTFIIFFLLFILTPLHLVWRLVNRDIRTSYTLEVSASLNPPTLSPGYQEVVDLRLLVCRSMILPPASTSSTTLSTHCSTPLLPIVPCQHSSPPIAVLPQPTPSPPSLHGTIPLNYWDIQGDADITYLVGIQEWYMHSDSNHPSAGHTPTALPSATWDIDKDMHVEQSEVATSAGWTPSMPLFPRSAILEHKEFDQVWADNVNICLHHHILEEGILEDLTVEITEEDFFCSH